MDKTMEIINVILDCQGSSTQCWDMAIATAKKPSDMNAYRNAAMECDQIYDEAVEALQNGEYDKALTAMQVASDIERFCGDNQHALRALGALDEYIMANHQFN